MSRFREKYPLPVYGISLEQADNLNILATICAGNIK